MALDPKIVEAEHLSLGGLQAISEVGFVFGRGHLLTLCNPEIAQPPTPTIGNWPNKSRYVDSGSSL